MRVLPTEQIAIWRSEDKTGDRRPIARATIQAPSLSWFNYDTGDQAGGDELHRFGVYTSIIFGNNHPLREIPNIMEVTWSRSVDQDVAQGQITLLNSEIVPIGSIGGSPDDFEIPGAMSPTHGNPGNPWGFAEEGWKNAIVPDAIIRTYEGYGCDPSVWPAQDEHLQLSGTWLVDDVTFTSDGEIQIKVRDIGRMLMDTMAWWPIIQVYEVPLQWSKRQPVRENVRLPQGGRWAIPRGRASSSNSLAIGRGLVEEDGGPYVDPNGAWRGHHPSHALNSNPHSYWMSTGYRFWTSNSFWSMKFSGPTKIAGVRVVSARNTPRVYVSLRTKDGWIGKKKIPRPQNSVRGIIQPESIPYVINQEVARDHWTDIVFKQAYSGVIEMRLTLRGQADLLMPTDAGPGYESSEWGHFFRRTGLRQVQVYTGAGAKVVSGSRSVIQGNYDDYTDIVKAACAWSGLFWPEPSTGRDFAQVAPGVKSYTHQDAPDPQLVRGRAWGDFQNAGTAGVEDLTADLFDKQPMWECIAQVRDILGFLALIDEAGGMIWRPPNTWKLGNYITPNDLSTRGVGRINGLAALHRISEDDVLQDYKMTLTSRNLRERVLIANNNGTPGALVNGYAKAGYRRLSAYTDLNLKTQAEVEGMADLIVARQLFTYRVGEPITIPGNPAIQVDDQFVLKERVTGDSYYHRVTSINSSLNMRDGVWTYSMNSHWIGDSVTGSLIAETATVVPNIAQVLANWGLL